MSKAPASSRATSHVMFSFGMVSIQLSIYTGTVSDHGIRRNQFITFPKTDTDGNPVTVEVEREDGTKEQVEVTEDHPVGNLAYDKTTGDPILDKSQVVRKINTEYGYVFVEDHEVEELFEIDPNTITVKEFQPQYLFHQGAYVPKSLAYVEVSKTTVGKKKVENTKAQQNFALILAAMRSNSAMAVVEITTRGVPKPGILMPNGTLWTLYHTDELREQRPMPEFEIPTEIAQAAFEQYLKPFWGEAPLDLSDKRSELIQAFADEKAKAGDFGQSVEVQAAAPAQPEPGDLMATLMASVEASKAESA